MVEVVAPAGMVVKDTWMRRMFLSGSGFKPLLQGTRVVQGATGARQ